MKSIELRNFKGNISKIYNKYGIVVILVGLLVICSIVSPVFMSKANIINLLSQIAVVTIIACGETMLLISGQVDLSGGSVVALTGCMCLGTFKSLVFQSGWGDIPAGLVAIAIAMGIGVVIHLLSGLIVTTFKAPAFIVTLAMMQAARGVVYLYTGAQPIFDVGNISILGQGRIGNLIPYSVLIMIGIIMITWVILKKMRLGRHIYASGGNAEAARASGVNVNRTIIETFMIHGAFIGLAGMLFMARLNSGQPAEAVGLEFSAITAAIIGGTSLNGGVGTVLGTVVGSIIIGVIGNILILKTVQAYIQMIITGVLIMIAVILDIRTKSKKR